MPELPEVETTVRGIAPGIVQRTVTDVIVRNAKLRWPVPRDLCQLLVGQKAVAVTRRGKYILINAGVGHVLIHLGMSGSLRIVSAATPPGPHDHVDIEFDWQRRLRLRDPRKFGCMLWIAGAVCEFHLLARLGPEPLNAEFDGFYLYRQSRTRSVAVKNFIMNSQIVVGVGNIYASEALFRAGIHPTRAARRISLPRYRKLALCIKQTLHDALVAGGTTLQDFVNESGEPGYFRPQLSVYGRAGQPCRRCGEPIARVIIGQRSTFYCKRCQR